MARSAAKPRKLPQSYELEFSPSGDFLITLGTRVARWDVADATVRFRSHPCKHPSYCAIHPREQLVALKTTSGEIVTISADDGATIANPCGKDRGEGSNLVFSEDGEYLVDGSWRGDLIVRSAVTGKVEFEHAFPGEMITSIARLPGNRWYVVHSPKVKSDHDARDPDYFSVWSWPFTRPIEVVRIGELRIRSFAVAPDADRMVMSSYDSVRLVRLSDRAELASAPRQYGGTGSGIAFSADGDEVAVVDKGRITFRSGETLLERRSVQIDSPSSVRYSPVGRHIAIGAWGSGLLMPLAEAQR